MTGPAAGEHQAKTDQDCKSRHERMVPNVSAPTVELTRRRESKHPSPHQASCEKRPRRSRPTICSTAPSAKAHVVNEMRVVSEICFAGNVNDYCTDCLGDLCSRPNALFAFECVRGMPK